MNRIKTIFSIKDLENLSGIKAHTIRIWEKRYNLLEPNRTNTNIRYYSLSSLQKLLNISYLNSNGYKISKIAKLKVEQIPSLVKEIADRDSEANHSVNLFKIAMLNFDLASFQSIYNDLLSKYSFEDIFLNIFIPLLDNIGLLWQTETISPAHEHFITELIKQKILIHTEKALTANTLKSKDRTFVLFLPENEIHELGLQFINYKLLLLGYHSIYLGISVPIQNLQDLKSHYGPITYISSFTIRPVKDDLETYIKTFNTTLLDNRPKDQLWVSGRLSSDVQSLLNNTSSIKTFYGVKAILESIKHG